jgi:hypothetical protein
MLMNLVIKYCGRKISFVFEGNDGTESEALGLSEHIVRKIRESGGPRLNVIAAKVADALKNHVRPNGLAVWVEQENKRLLACPA